jgi:hypothetical protein
MRSNWALGDIACKRVRRELVPVTLLRSRKAFRIGAIFTKLGRVPVADRNFIADCFGQSMMQAGLPPPVNQE